MSDVTRSEKIKVSPPCSNGLVCLFTGEQLTRRALTLCSVVALQIKGRRETSKRKVSTAALSAWSLGEIEGWGVTTMTDLI